MVAAMRSLRIPPAAWRRVVRRSGDGGARSSRLQGRAAAGLIAAAMLCAACSFEYSEAGAAPEQLLEHIPETEFTGVTRTIVRDGRVVAEVRAERVWNFRRRARTILQDVHYTEYDAAGNAVTTGSAERAVYYTEREDAALSGSIRLRSEAQGVTVQAQALRWEDGPRRLVSTPGDVVEFTRDDGSHVRGDGLEADARRKTIRFSGAVSGTLVAQSDGGD